MLFPANSRLPQANSKLLTAKIKHQKNKHMKSFKLIYLLIIFCVLAQYACKEDPVPEPDPVDSPSRVEEVSFYSTVLGIDMDFKVWLPPGYDESPESYPTVYLFWICINNDPAEIDDKADELYYSGQIGKMILVFSLDAPVNWLSPELCDCEDVIGTGQFEDYYIEDLLPYVDSAYRTINDRMYRGTDGFSTGAIRSAILGFKHPELFRTIAFYDGHTAFKDFNDPRIDGELDDAIWMDSPGWDPIFGNPRDTAYMKLYSPVEILDNADTEELNLLKSMKYFIHAADSTDDTAPAEGTYYWRVKHLVDKMASKGIINYFEELILYKDANHECTEAIEHLEITLPLHWEHFGSNK
jgi:hypothetical protein